MASPAGHALMGAAIYFSSVSPLEYAKRYRWGMFLVIVSVLPDIDFLPFLWGDTSLANAWHQQATHSITFAAAATIAIVGIARLLKVKVPATMTLLIFLTMIAHILIDVLNDDTSPPCGPLVFWPFSAFHLQSPIRIFYYVSRTAFPSFINVKNAAVVLREVVFFGFLITAAIMVRIGHERKKLGS